MNESGEGGLSRPESECGCNAEAESTTSSLQRTMTLLPEDSDIGTSATAAAASSTARRKRSAPYLCGALPIILEDVEYRDASASHRGSEPPSESRPQASDIAAMMGNFSLLSGGPFAAALDAGAGPKSTAAANGSCHEAQQAASTDTLHMAQPQT